MSLWKYEMSINVFIVSLRGAWELGVEELDKSTRQSRYQRLQQEITSSMGVVYRK
jgi:hypothetical protein